MRLLDPSGGGRGLPGGLGGQLLPGGLAAGGLAGGLLGAGHRQGEDLSWVWRSEDRNTSFVEGAIDGNGEKKAAGEDFIRLSGT